jgi:Domain of unknown function (DUF6089)
MKKLFLVIGILMSAAFAADAQFLEAGFEAGEMHYIGDMSVHKLGDRKEAHAAFGAFLRNTFLNGYASWRIGLMLGKISGNDKDFPTSNSLYYRNLNFDSYVQDFHFLFDINLLGANPCKDKFWSPYITGGVSVFHFNPYSTYYGQNVYLQPLGTEGQGIAQLGNRPKYSLFQPSFPVGVGVKIIAEDVFVVSFEIMYHITLTDYLDDVSGNYYDTSIIRKYNGKIAAYMSNRSNYKIKYDANGVGNIQRGNSSNKDAFVTSTINVSYIIENRCGIAYRRRMQTKCTSIF